MKEAKLEHVLANGIRCEENPCTLNFMYVQVPINETNTQFVEQTIAIMKNLLDNHTEGSSEHLGQASIETMMLNLVR